jgi:hypothetical protein
LLQKQVIKNDTTTLVKPCLVPLHPYYITGFSSRVIFNFGGIYLRRFFSSDTANGSGDIKPVVIYSNADTQKVLIFKENRNKSGIYR